MATLTRCVGMVLCILFSLYGAGAPFDTIDNIQNTPFTDTLQSAATEYTHAPDSTKRYLAAESVASASGNDLKNLPEIGGDAVKIFQASPGFSRLVFGNAEPIVRGAGIGSTRFYLDGCLLPVFFHPWFFSVYNSNALESVDAYPGGFGTRYGGALAGIVELTGRKPAVNGFHGFTDANFFNASLLAEGPISKTFSLLATARQSYERTKKPLYDFFGQTPHAGETPDFFDYTARIDAEVSKNQHFYLTFFGSRTKQEVSAASAGSLNVSSDADVILMETHSAFTMGIFGWAWNNDNGIKNDVHYALCKFEQGNEIFGYSKIGGATLAHSFRDQLSWSNSDKLKWAAGIDLQIIPYDLTVSLPTARGEVFNDTSHIVMGPMAAYAFAEWKPLPRLKLVPGIRFDYYPELGQQGSIVPEFFDYSFKNNKGISGTEPSMRISATYELERKHSINASIGTYNQTPQPGGQAVDSLWGNPKLPLEKGSQSILGYEWKMCNLISLDVQAYYNRQWDLARVPSTIEIEAAAAQGQNVPKYLSDGIGRMEGMELTIKHRPSKCIFGCLSYSLSRSERLSPIDNKWRLFGYDRTHCIQFAGSARFKWLQEAGVRFELATADPETPISAPLYFDATSRIYVPTYGELNSGRAAPYFSLDFRYEKRFIFKSCQLTAYLDVRKVENLFPNFAENFDGSAPQWNYDYTRKIVHSDDVRPALGVKVTF
jgi:hypothetical protein